MRTLVDEARVKVAILIHYATYLAFGIWWLYGGGEFFKAVDGWPKYFGLFPIAPLTLPFVGEGAAKTFVWWLILLGIFAARLLANAIGPRRVVEV